MLNTCSGMFYEKTHMSDSIPRGKREHHHVVCLSRLTSGGGGVLSVGGKGRNIIVHCTEKWL